MIKIIEEKIAKNRIRTIVEKMDLAKDGADMLGMFARMYQQGISTGKNIADQFLVTVQDEVKENAEAVADIGYALYRLKKTYDKHHDKIVKSVNSIEKKMEDIIAYEKQQANSEIESAGEDFEKACERAGEFFEFAKKTLGLESDEKTPEPEEEPVVDDIESDEEVEAAND